MSEYSKAEIDFKKIVSLNPNNLFAMINMSALYSLIKKKPRMPVNGFEKGIEKGYTNSAFIKTSKLFPEAPQVSVL